MTTIDHRINVPAGPVEEFVHVDELVCNGCGCQVRPEPPVGWPASAGAAPEFCHGDGSVLCPDERGRIGEPLEAPGATLDRYVLTESGRAALDAGGRS